MTITKQQDGNFKVRTGEFTTDLREIGAVCRLNGNTLQTIYQQGVIVLTPIRVKLGTKSLAAVSALSCGESVTIS